MISHTAKYEITNKITNIRKQFQKHEVQGVAKKIEFLFLKVITHSHHSRTWF